MATELDVKLISAYWSPFSQRVHIALLEKGIPFENIAVNLSDKPQILIDSNPIHKKIPVLLHKGKPVVESLVILEYLDEAFPDAPKLLPEDVYEKSKIRFWAEYLYGNFATFFEIFKNPKGSPGYIAASESLVKLVKTVDEGIASFSADGPYFAGKKFGYLDVVYAPIMGFFFIQESRGVELPGAEEVPRFTKWAKAVKEHPSVKAVLPTDEAFETMLYVSRTKEGQLRQVLHRVLMGGWLPKSPVFDGRSRNINFIKESS